MAKRKAAPDSSKKPAKRPIEQYAHTDKKRANNPPVGLVTPATDPPETARKTYAYDPHLDPQLVWAGKAERTSFEVPTVSLHVHERIDPKTIIEAVKTNGHGQGGTGRMIQGSLFDQPAENPPLREAIDFYKHSHGWSNRLIAGDSLLVMNSLLEKEGMAGKVQMVYLDPPYGIRYRSNFQPFVNRREVGESDRDEDLTQEPETVQAFRDTWELGIHSYLAYLRDRLVLAHQLLAPSGSCFVQISDENLHLVRNILDDVFGADCLVVTIPVKKKGSQKSGLLDPVNDYLVWFSKTPRTDQGAQSITFRPLFRRRELDEEALSEFKFLELEDGRIFPVSSVPIGDSETKDYRSASTSLMKDFPRSRLFRSNPMTSGGERKNQSLPYEFQGKVYSPGKGNCWKTTVRSDSGDTPGMKRLEFASRLLAGTGQLRFKSYFDDFGYVPVSNWWDGFGGASRPIYVVQTNEEIVQRCILMTTDPGDLVIDPTCGSGTTAVVAERWGRRWITCDTSRVAVTLAKQRLMTADFEYFDLAQPAEGIGSGFRYRTASHVTLGSIANNPEVKEAMNRIDIDAAIARCAEQETLFDQPFVDRAKVRVTGPFTVEAVPALTVLPIDDFKESPASDVSVVRSGVTLRQDEWRDEMARTGVRAQGGKRVEFTRLEPLAGARYLHAIGETKNGNSKRIAVSFGPEHSPLEQRQVELAWEEARGLSPRPEIVVFAAFHFDPEAAKDIDELDPQKTGMTFLRSQMNTDLLTEDLKKKRSSNESFWLIGQPDVDLRRVKNGGDKGKWQVEIRGFDYYNPTSGQIESGDSSKIAMWLLDTDYDGRSLLPRQVFFPMAGPKDGWARLAKSLKAEIDEDKIEAYRGTKSLPFEEGRHKRVAVKIVDDRGIESLKLVELG
ncbi:MAG: site-specific DNA-methyltransferase [Fimbriimonadaceae bacterium]|nr:site-specific DNA-methyltransferase [Fimbriimonadaceae bacterium]